MERETVGEEIKQALNCPSLDFGWVGFAVLLQNSGARPFHRDIQALIPTNFFDAACEKCLIGIALDKGELAQRLAPLFQNKSKVACAFCFVSLLRMSFAVHRDRLLLCWRATAVSPGNFAGGLTMIEEKSMGAFGKSGHSPIEGAIRVADRPRSAGPWLLDSVPDEHFMQFGFTNSNAIEGIMDLISATLHILLLLPVGQCPIA